MKRSVAVLVTKESLSVPPKPISKPCWPRTGFAPNVVAPHSVPARHKVSGRVLLDQPLAATTVKISNSQSPADRAFQHFEQIVVAKGIFQHDTPQLSESDTRSKLIDPLFKQVL